MCVCVCTQGEMQAAVVLSLHAWIPKDLFIAPPAFAASLLCCHPCSVGLRGWALLLLNQ